VGGLKTSSQVPVDKVATLLEDTAQRITRMVLLSRKYF
jgi:hypothetical protein